MLDQSLKAPCHIDRPHLSSLVFHGDHETILGLRTPWHCLVHREILEEDRQLEDVQSFLQPFLARRFKFGTES